MTVVTIITYRPYNERSLGWMKMVEAEQREQMSRGGRYDS